MIETIREVTDLPLADANQGGMTGTKPGYDFLMKEKGW